LYYTAAYAFAGIASFAVIIFVSQHKGSEEVNAFNGFGKSNPLMAAILTASLLSMAGIPIFSGFFAKFILFTQTIQTGYLSLVIIAVINSIISVGYYFKIIIAMYTKESTEEKITVPFVYIIVAVIAILLNIIIGISPAILTHILA
jgi:NADH-quinone oxidoreductase subunit N